jgi:hypothetical protein
MRKLTLRWLLPALFLGFSATELALSDHIDALLQPLRPYVGRIGDLWHALNAPGLFFLAIGIHFAPIRRPEIIANVPIETALFLMGGIVLWFAVGQILDHRKQTTNASMPQTTVRVAQVFMVLWGIYLCSQALHAISATDYLGRRVPGSIIDGGIVLVWSLVLIILPATSLTRAVRSRGKSSRITTDEPA